MNRIRGALLFHRGHAPVGGRAQSGVAQAGVLLPVAGLSNHPVAPTVIPKGGVTRTEDR